MAAAIEQHGRGDADEARVPGAALSAIKKFARHSDDNVALLADAVWERLAADKLRHRLVALDVCAEPLVRGGPRHLAHLLGVEDPLPEAREEIEDLATSKRCSLYI